METEGIFMADCFEYLDWRGDLSFAADPFNEIDGMLLSRISYMPFELIGESGAITVGEACEKFLTIPDIEEKLLVKGDMKLIEHMAKSPRFGNLKIINYENRREEASETQFAAVTFPLGNLRYYVAFRGTDETIVGWKEDFNMSFTTPVPAQEMAVGYFENIASRLRGKFILGGHSKGGNLAVYAGAFCSPRLRAKIMSVQNFDGPGFDSKVFQTPGYRAILPRISTYIPQSSIIGMLLDHKEEYKVVKSRSVGIFQHDTYSWELLRNRFVYVDTVSDSSKFIDDALKEWLVSVTPETRELLVDTLYEIFNEMNVKTVKELGENWLINAASAVRAIRNIDPETRKTLNVALRALAKVAKKVYDENRTGKEIEKTEGKDNEKN